MSSNGEADQGLTIGLRAARPGLRTPASQASDVPYRIEPSTIGRHNDAIADFRYVIP